MVDRYIENETNPVGILFSDGFVEKFKRLCLRQLKKYKAMGFTDSITYILTQWRTWDNFSLSVIYLNFFYYIYGKKKIPKQDFIKIILELLLLNVHPNPEMRLSIKETVLVFNDKLMNFVQNLSNFKFIMNLNKDFVENKDEFKKRRNIQQTVMDTMTKKNKRKI